MYNMHVFYLHAYRYMSLCYEGVNWPHSVDIHVHVVMLRTAWRCAY